MHEVTAHAVWSRQADVKGPRIARGGDRIRHGIKRAEVDEDIRNRALRMILGEDGRALAGPTRRHLYGEPWTLAGARARLSAPDELLSSRPWYALEMAVRSGAQPLLVFGKETAARVQEVFAAQVGAAVASQRRAVADGGWSYFGKAGV